jgi:hypothetical protein
MTGKPPPREFGKRKPAVAVVPQPAPKRSNHVALLVMGTLAVGSGAYALMPRENCTAPQPAAPGMAAPALPPSSTCTRSSSYGGSGGRSWSSFHFYGGDSSSRASSGGGSESSSGGVTRGGFGSLAHAFGFGGGG